MATKIDPTVIHLCSMVMPSSSLTMILENKLHILSENHTQSCHLVFLLHGVKTERGLLLYHRIPYRTNTTGKSEWNNL